MRSILDKNLNRVNDELIQMGASIEEAIAAAVTSFSTQDTILAKKTVENDKFVNDQQKSIESLCMNILLTQHPVATDLRIISTAMKIVTDMERIGDQAADICEMTISMSKEPYIMDMQTFKTMAIRTTEMVNDAVDAYVRRDAELARKVIDSDDIVDDLFMQARKQLIQKINDDIRDGEQAADLMMVAKYFERIGDHATNIGEAVIYCVTGEIVD